VTYTITKIDSVAFESIEIIVIAEYTVRNKPYGGTCTFSPEQAEINNTEVVFKAENWESSEDITNYSIKNAMNSSVLVETLSAQG
jgi:hypothetical protein